MKIALLDVRSPGTSFGPATDGLWDGKAVPGDLSSTNKLYDFMAPSDSTEKQTELSMFSFSREKTARNAYSFWFSKGSFQTRPH